jgi:ribosomal protein S27E
MNRCVNCSNEMNRVALSDAWIAFEVCPGCGMIYVHATGGGVATIAREEWNEFVRSMEIAGSRVSVADVRRVVDG